MNAHVRNILNNKNIDDLGDGEVDSLMQIIYFFPFEVYNIKNKIQDFFKAIMDEADNKEQDAIIYLLLSRVCGDEIREHLARVYQLVLNTLFAEMLQDSENNDVDQQLMFMMHTLTHFCCEGTVLYKEIRAISIKRFDLLLNHLLHKNIPASRHTEPLLPSLVYVLKSNVPEHQWRDYEVNLPSAKRVKLSVIMKKIPIVATSWFKRHLYKCDVQILCN